MEAAPISRRLAAVLVADVAGYSRLMERDETGTHVRIRALLSEVVEPAIAKNHGHLLKTLGDGVLAEFPSATDAVRCAVEIQRQMPPRNRGVASQEQILLRIGINVADVLFDQADIAGGGVNLAARLETLAPPGGICISQASRDQIHEDLGVTYLDVGSRRVKNISKPVRVVLVLIDAPTPLERVRLLLDRPSVKLLGLVSGVGLILAVASAVVVQTPSDAEPEKLSLQVGQFRPAETADAEAARMGKLIAQQIYLALSPERHLLKIKGSPSAESVGSTRRPIARYVIEGIITPIDGEFRIDARLVSTRTSETLWGDAFRLRDASLHSIDEGAHRIAHALHWEVMKPELQRIKASPPRNPDAMDLVLMGTLALRGGEAGAKEAKQLFKQALALDAANVPALLSLSMVSEAAEEDRLTQRAVIADPHCADSWSLRGEVLWRLGQTEAAREAVARALRINSANQSAQVERDRQLLNEGQWGSVIRPLEEVEFEFGKSIYLRSMLGSQCQARLLAGQDAAQACDRWFAVAGSEAALIYATAAAARNGSTEQALQAGGNLRSRFPQFTIAAHRDLIKTSKLHSPRYLVHVEEVVFPALLKAGIPEN